MADLNLRNVPDEVMRSLKMDAVSENITLRDLCLRRLVPDGGASWRPQTVTGQPIKEPVARPRKMIMGEKPRARESASPTVREVESVQEVEKPAPSYGRPAHAVGCKCGMCQAVRR